MKKTLPLTVLKSIKKVAERFKQFSNITIVEQSSNGLFFIKANDADFYFVFNKFEQRDEKVLYYVKYKPCSEDHLNAAEIGVWSDQLETHIDSWFKLVNQYDEIYPLFDDPIAEHYYHELNFDIIDADAEVAPFDLQRQGYLMEIYDNLIQKVENEKTENNKDEAEALIKRIDAAQQQLPKTTKREAVNTFRKVIAFCRKYSYKVAISIIAETLVEIGKVAIKAIF